MLDLDEETPSDLAAELEKIDGVIRVRTIR